MTIQPKSPYSVILATAKSPEGILASDNEIIVMAIARTHNSKMNIVGDLLVNAGEPPVILEQVKAMSIMSGYQPNRFEIYECVL